MDDAERPNAVDDASELATEAPADAAAATGGWAVPVVQTLPLTSGPSTTDARRPSAGSRTDR